MAAVLIVAGLGAPVWAAAAQDPLAGGIASYQTGNYPLALSFFLRAVELRPSDPRAWVWLAATHLKLNHPSEAVPALRRALAIDSTNGAAYLLLGFAYSLLGRRQEAAHAFELALRYAPTPEYASAAREWLQSLQAAPAPAVIPPASHATCPSPPRLPVAKAPPPAPDRRTQFEFSEVEFVPDGDHLQLTGLLVNRGGNRVRDVRAALTMFGLTGQVVFESVITADGELESGDGKEFAVRLPTALPPLWGRLVVVDFAGRSGQEPLDVAHVTVPLDAYRDLAKRRVKIGSVVIPAAVSSRHLICLWIADAAGLPVSEARVRLRISALNSNERAPQTRTLLVGRDEVTSLEASWSRPTMATIIADVERVELASSP